MTRKSTTKLLKHIQKKKQIARFDIETLWGENRENCSEYISHLVFQKYIFQSSPPDYDQSNGGQYVAHPQDTFEISEHGKAYLEDQKKDFNRMWVPHIISNFIALAALIMSALALLKQ